MKYYNSLTNRIFILVLLLSNCFLGFSQPLSQEELQKMPLYISLEAAAKEPEKVYRLQLIGSPKMDSLPEVIFSFPHLQELTVRRCKLMILNRHISQLHELQYLNLDHNRLVTLPEELFSLPSLRTLIFSRNMISSLPDEIGESHSLEEIIAWENPLYTLPDNITLLAENLKSIDLRQIGFKKTEIEKIEQQLPKTTILYTNLCDCHNNRN